MLRKHSLVVLASAFILANTQLSGADASKPADWVLQDALFKALSGALAH